MSLQDDVLKALDVRDPDQVALYMPMGYLEPTRPVDDFHTLTPGELVVVRGTVTSPPVRDPQPSINAKRPGFIFTMEGQQGVLTFTVDEDVDALSERIVGAGEVYVAGRAKTRFGKLELEAISVLDPNVSDKCLPVYPAVRGKIGTDRITQFIRSNFAALSSAAVASIRDTFSITPGQDQNVLNWARTRFSSLADLMLAAHFPRTLEEGRHAQSVWETLSALYLARGLLSATKKRTGEEYAFQLPREVLEETRKAIPFDLVTDQRNAIKRIVTELRRPEQTHHLINGDVGTGKTIVFLTIAAASAKDGKRVAIMAPSSPLASQIYNELDSLWPEIPKQFVTGDTPRSEPIDKSIVVGTQALCHRLGPNDGIDLVIVDEQQRYSVEQRECFLSTHGNIIEATATCIPRTMALLQFGNISVSQIRQQHSSKHVITRLMEPEQRREVYAQVKGFLNKDERVLIIYPFKERQANIESGEIDKSSLVESFEIWDRLFPGQARMLHGSMKPEEKSRVLDELKRKERKLLVATTVVEVGLNIPDLQYAVVVNPDRSGLVTLHQIRGRLVRNGGTGLFDMLSLKPISQKTRQRLSVLEDTNDGFEISEQDLKLRGAGDLQSDGKTQSGKSSGLLVQRPVNTEYVRFFLDALTQTSSVAA